MRTRRLKIAVKDHGGKSLALVNALHAAGHELVSSGPADLLLIDFDPPWFLHRELIDYYKGIGAKVLLYPHGGGLTLSYDALWEPDRRVDANLVTGSGQAEFLRRIEYPSPSHTIGWSYCEMQPFRACADVRHVVFAPMHPNGDGSLVDSCRELNANVFERLLQCPWRLTVRHIGTLEQNGLWAVDGVQFVNGRNAPVTTEIDVADAVVAALGTFPTLAIACGVPTVVYDQGIAALGLPGETSMVPLRRPGLYMDYIRYPFDAIDGPLEELVHAAARSEAATADWKRRFVGTPFDPGAFVALVERIVSGNPAPVRIDPTRSFTTLGFADEMIERPELLQIYAECFRAEDDATLIMWAPGVGASALLAMAERAIETAGLDPDRLPDILLAPLPGSPEADLRLGERADAVLSEWPPVGCIGTLPSFGAEDSQILRAAAEAAWSPASLASAFAG